MTPRFHVQWLFLLFLLTEASLSAQQTPYGIFYRSNWQFVNPAAIDRSHYLTRYHNTTVMNIGARRQWIGLGGAPNLYFVSAEYCPQQFSGNQPAGKFGITAFGDFTDAIGTVGLNFNYSRFFPIPYTRGHVLHFGLGVGANRYQINWQKIRLAQPGDLLEGAYEGQFYADFAMGAMYRIRKEFYVGVSLPQIFTLNVIDKSPATGKFRKDLAPYIYFNIGGFIQCGEYDYSSKSPDETTIVIEPSAWIRIARGVSYNTTIPNSPFSIDANIRVHYKQRFWIGAGYGTNSMLNTEVGIGGILEESGNKWQLGLGYGVPLGKKYLNLGHSIELSGAYYFN